MLKEGEGLGVRVVVVSFAIPEYLRLYRREMGLPDELLMLSDTDREAYRWLGFGRASTARVWLDPRVWWRYASLIARGRRPQPAQDDPLQLGGDALLDASGDLAWVYSSAGPEDRPSLRELRAAIAALGPQPPASS